MVVVARDGIEPPTSVDTICVDQLLDLGEPELAFSPQRRCSHSWVDSGENRDELGRPSPILFSTNATAGKKARIYGHFF
jgi:hypothetical protein